METIESASWLKRWKLPRPLLSGSLLVFLLVVNFAMLTDTLVHGPTWYDDYGLGGMQYGTAPIFKAIRVYLQQNPDAQIVLSPSWSNGTDVVARFFLSDPLPIQMGSIEGYLNQRANWANSRPVLQSWTFLICPLIVALLCHCHAQVSRDTDISQPAQDHSGNIVLIVSITLGDALGKNSVKIIIAS